MKRDDLEYTPDLVVMDVSFISATCIIPAIYEVAKDGADFICLVKPQFEVGRAGIGKGGIVKEERLRKSALDKVIEFAKAVGFDYIDSCFSPIKGGDGNIEYLVHFIVRKE
jgi:23S rRNA (cytidine1920-2'-O)/16S rRNA (cytidine1409-2'-O)-methyltransferase